MTGHDGTVAMSSANELLDVGFASRYQWVGVWLLHPLLSY